MAAKSLKARWRSGVALATGDGANTEESGTLRNFCEAARPGWADAINLSVLMNRRRPITPVREMTSTFDAFACSGFGFHSV